MADVAPAPGTDATATQAAGSASRFGHWVSDAVHQAQDLGKKAWQSKAGQEIKDSGQHIVNNVVKRGKSVPGAATEAAAAANQVAHEAAAGKVNPAHVVNAGEKAAKAAAAVSPHAIIAGAVTDEVARKVPLPQGARETMGHAADPKHIALKAAQDQVNQAVKNLPTLEIGGLHRSPEGAGKPGDTSRQEGKTPKQ